MSATFIDNTPLQTPPAPGINRYSVSVPGGTLFVAEVQSPTGQTLGVSQSFVPTTQQAQTVETDVTASVGATLTAAQLLTGYIVRSGPTAAFTDTTDTAANIQAAWAGVLGSTFLLTIANTTLFAQTIAGGSGVTLTGVSLILPLTEVQYLLAYTGAGAMTMRSIGVAPRTPAPQFVASAGATQGDATAITALKAIINVAHSASTKGVRLYTAATGVEVEIGNAGSFGVKVYPPTGGQIGAAATNAADGTVLAINKVNRYVAVSSKKWIVQRGA